MMGFFCVALWEPKMLTASVKRECCAVCVCTRRIKPQDKALRLFVFCPARCQLYKLVAVGT